MDKKKSLILFRLELFWWLATALLLAGVLYPIYKTTPNYPFWESNIVYILTFVTLTRHLFLLKHTFLGHIQWAKPVALVLCIPLMFYSINQMHTFTVYADEIGLEGLFKNASPESQTGMISYTQTEMLFFGVGSIIATALFPFRMVISYWRTHNRGTI